MFKPMLASKVRTDKLSYPLIVQVKLDGIRASVVEGVLVSRTLKPIRNAEIQEALGRPEFNGLDGELIVGKPEAAGCMQATSSFVMSPDKYGADWTYYVFDKWDTGPCGYVARIEEAHSVLADEGYPARMTTVEYKTIHTEQELDLVEAAYVGQGHEGVIVRDPSAPYKFGRASATKGELGKIKRFDDSEARIIGVYEEQHNANEAVTNALGRTERSSVQANKIGKGTLGGFEVEDIYTGIRFRVGTGFTAQERDDYWNIVEGRHIGAVIKYKSFSIGVKEKPRHPVFLGFRDPDDIS